MSENIHQEEQAKQQKLVAKISQLTQMLGISTYDVLLIGDGSGSGWNLATGWACTLIDRYSSAAKLFYGGANCGTISIAELMPYLHAMTWFFSQDGPGHDRLKAALANRRALVVHVITDSAYIANCGNAICERKVHPHLWAAMDYFSTLGVVMIYHHWNRSEVTLNVLADEVSRQTRYTVAEAYQRGINELAKKFPGVSTEASVYDFFLWE